MKEILLNKRNQKVFIIALFVAILVFASFSYAYFIGSIGGSASTDVDVTTTVNERLVFTEGNPIGIHATLDNFFDGAGSLDGETTTNVKLNAGSQSSTATELYQVYFDITTNDFEYSVDNTTPELVLTITDPEGNTLTEATLPDGTTINTKTVTTLVQDGLGGTTSQSVVGFDVTEVSGIIKLYEDYSITNTNPTIATEQNWTAKVTFINLDAEQTINEGKTFNANLLLQQDKLTSGNKMISGPAFAALTNEYRADMVNGTQPVKELHKIIFNDTINETAYNNATDKWDVSEESNGSVVAYVVTENTDNVMYIESNGKIIAHEVQGVVDIDNFYPSTGTEVPTFNEMHSIFMGFSHLTEINFNNSYDTSNVKNMSGMFAFLSSNINLIELNSINTASVTNMSYMFLMGLGNHLDLSSFDTTNVINMEGMFYSSPIESVNLESFNTSKTINMKGMFFGSGGLTSLNLENFNTNSVTDMSFMFYSLRYITTLDLSLFNTSKVNDMQFMFTAMENLNNINLNSFQTTNVINMKGMFQGLINITSLNLNTFNTSKVKDMSSMFATMPNLQSLDLSYFDTSNVTDMSEMFSLPDSYIDNGISYEIEPSLENLDIGSFSTSNVIDMSEMFKNQTNLTELDLSSFDVSNADTSDMFSKASSLNSPLYARTTTDMNTLNDRATTGLKTGVSFTVKP